MVDIPENTRHDQLKRDDLACSTYQQILKAYTKYNLINYLTKCKKDITLLIVLISSDYY